MAGLVGTVGVGLTAPASACPPGARCVTALRARHIETPALVRPPPRYLSLTVRLSFADDRHEALKSSLTTFHPVRVSVDDVEMPWIWAVLAAEVENHLPRYEKANEFSMVLSPVVVSMPSESTPGLGLSGDF